MLVFPANTVCDVCASAIDIVPHAVTISVLLADEAELACGVVSVAVTVKLYVPGGVTPQVVATVTLDVALFPPPVPVTVLALKFTVVPAGRVELVIESVAL